jgi:death-on-curing protein
VAQVLYIHYQMVKEYGGIPGVKDLNSLESAVYRSQQTAFGEELFPTVFLKAAVLLHSIAMNHAFHDGNKRTATTATGLFLKMNGYSITAGQQDLEDFVVAVVDEKLGIEKISDWLSINTQKLI